MTKISKILKMRGLPSKGGLISLAQMLCDMTARDTAMFFRVLEIPANGFRLGSPTPKSPPQGVNNIAMFSV